MSRWFRHYAGMMRDEKLVSAAVRSKQPVERVVWVWGAILESAAEINDGGRYDFDTAEAAYFLHCDESELVSIVECLQGLGRVADGCVARWSERQFDSDSSKERQRRYRERIKANSPVQERNDDVGEASRSVTSDGRVTSRDGAVTPQETDTETYNVDADASTQRAAARAPAEFTEFWSLYPHKVGKRDAVTAFAKARKRASFDAIMDGLRRYVVKTDDRPWCNPATWLNQDRWEDMPATVPRAPSTDPPRRGVVGAAQRIFESEGHGPSSIFGNHSDVELLPPASGHGQRDAAEDVLSGPAWYSITGNH